MRLVRLDHIRQSLPGCLSLAGRGFLLIGFLLIPSVLSAAGTIYFQDGQSVQADDWWEQDGVLYYVTKRHGREVADRRDVVRIDGQPASARAYRRSARLHLVDGTFQDVGHMFVTTDSVRYIREDGATVTLQRSEVMRIEPIPLDERACAATTVTLAELESTRRLVEFLSQRGPEYTRQAFRLRQCFGVRQRAFRGEGVTPEQMRKACCVPDE